MEGIERVTGRDHNAIDETETLAGRDRGLFGPLNNESVVKFKIVGGVPGEIDRTAIPHLASRQFFIDRNEVLCGVTANSEVAGVNAWNGSAALHYITIPSG